jgi:hypothetical protein
MVIDSGRSVAAEPAGLFLRIPERTLSRGCVCIEHLIQVVVRSLLQVVELLGRKAVRVRSNGRTRHPIRFTVDFLAILVQDLEMKLLRQRQSQPFGIGIGAARESAGGRRAEEPFMDFSGLQNSAPATIARLGIV